jgi:hypothetical protein
LTGARICIHLRSFNVSPSPYSKLPWKKITIQIKLVCPWSFTVPNFVCLSATVQRLSPWNKMCILNFNRPPCLYNWFFRKVISLQVHFLKICQQKIIVPRWLVQVLHSPPKFERPPFSNGWSYGIKNHVVDITSVAWPPYWIS